MKKPVAVLLGFIMATCGMSVQAGVIGFTADISNSFHVDVPTFTFSNTSTMTAEITSINITIGHSGKHFDFSSFQNSSPGIAFTLTSPDTNNGGLRSKSINYEYSSGFSSGNFFEFRADIDPDFFNDGAQDFRSTLFNNGLENNSTITVGFSNGAELALVLPDAPTQDSYSFSQSSVAVPEPSSFVLMGLNFCALAISRRKRTDQSTFSV